LELDQRSIESLVIYQCRKEITTLGDKPQTHTTRANEKNIEPFDSSRCANCHSMVLVPLLCHWTVLITSVTITVLKQRSICGLAA
jgi:hypothetical protein